MQATQPCRCAICGVDTSMQQGFGVHIDLPASWKLPVWGNSQTNVRNRTLAVVCKRCGMKEKVPGQLVREVIEWDENKQRVIYHPIKWTQEPSGILLPHFVYRFDIKGQYYQTFFLQKNITTDLYNFLQGLMMMAANAEATDCTSVIISIPNDKQGRLNEAVIDMIEHLLIENCGKPKNGKA